MLSAMTACRAIEGSPRVSARFPKLRLRAFFQRNLPTLPSNAPSEWKISILDGTLEGDAPFQPEPMIQDSPNKARFPQQSKIPPTKQEAYSVRTAHE